MDIPLERKCTREDPSVGGNVMKPMPDPIFNFTAYAWVLSSTFSLQEDILNQFYSGFTIWWAARKSIHLSLADRNVNQISVSPLCYTSLRRNTEDDRLAKCVRRINFDLTNCPLLPPKRVRYKWTLPNSFKYTYCVPTIWTSRHMHPPNAVNNKFGSLNTSLMNFKMILTYWWIILDILKERKNGPSVTACRR